MKDREGVPLPGVFYAQSAEDIRRLILDGVEPGKAYRMSVEDAS